MKQAKTLTWQGLPAIKRMSYEPKLVKPLVLEQWVDRHKGLREWLTDRATDLNGYAKIVDLDIDRRKCVDNIAKKMKRHINSLVGLLSDNGPCDGFIALHGWQAFGLTESQEPKSRIESITYGMNDDQKKYFYTSLDYENSLLSLLALDEKVTQAKEQLPKQKGRSGKLLEAFIHEEIKKHAQEIGATKIQVERLIDAVFEAAGRSVPDEKTIGKLKEI